MPKIEEITEEEQQRIIEESGILHRLPPDFIPFDPTALGGPLAPPSGSRRARQSSQPETWIESTDDEQSDDDSNEKHGRDDRDLGSLSRNEADRLLREGGASSSAESPLPRSVELVLDLIIWTMPFAFLFLMLDIMIQQQYAQHPTVWIELGRLLGTLPFLAAFIFFTMPNNVRADNQNTIASILFAVSVAAGSSFLFIFHRSEWLVVIRRTPPLGTVWIYTIVRASLPSACLSLACVGAFMLYYKLPLLGD